MASKYRIVKAIREDKEIPLEEDSFYTVLSSVNDYHTVILNNGQIKIVKQNLFRNLSSIELEKPRLYGKST